MFKEIFLDAPCVGEAEKEYLCKAVDSGFVSSFGPFVPEFEIIPYNNIVVFVIY